MNALSAPGLECRHNSNGMWPKTPGKSQKEINLFSSSRSETGWQRWQNRPKWNFKCISHMTDWLTWSIDAKCKEMFSLGKRFYLLSCQRRKRTLGIGERSEQIRILSFVRLLVYIIYNAPTFHTSTQWLWPAVHHTFHWCVSRVASLFTQSISDKLLWTISMLP